MSLFIVFETSVLYQQWVITLATTLQPTRIIPPFLVCQEGMSRSFLLSLTHNSTKRIVGCSNVSRTEHHCAQTREVACTKIVLPQVLEKGSNMPMP